MVGNSRLISRVLVIVLLAGAAFVVSTRREASIAETPEIGDEQAASVADAIPQAPSSPAVPIRVPAPEPPAPPPAPTAPSPAPAPAAPSVIRLRVPFVSQAPFRVWDLPYKEFCEEASVLTLHLWAEGKPTPPADQLDHELKSIQGWEIANLSGWEDTSADEVVRILREKYGHAKARVVRDVTIESMKAELRKKRPLIVPAAGRDLPNPYFRQPGPLYHMLVVIGYDDATGEFITNDVGTNTKGAGLRYAYRDLYDAMHDWNADAQAPTGGKVMVVLE